MKKLLFVLAVLAMACCVFADAAADIEAGRQAAAKADLAFLWGSDTHHQVNPKYGAQQDVIDDFVASANGMKVDFAALTGDIVNGYYNKEHQQKDLEEVMSFLDKAKMPVLITMGNHDDNSWFISGEASEKELGSTDELFPKEDFYRTVLKGHEKEFARDSKNPYGGWFYKDFTDAKVRVIMLNCEDIPYIPKDGGGLKFYGQWSHGFGEAQLNWLANKALRFSKKGWGVIIMTHVDFCYDKNIRPANGDVVQKLISAYSKNEAGVIVSEKEDFGAKVRYNFTRNVSNEIIGCFGGHWHKDVYKYVDGVPHILITTIVGQNGGYDLVTIDRKKRLISTRRFLAGAAVPELNREFAY